MKKVLLVLFMICMCLSGCSNNSESETVGGQGSTYDYVEYDTVEQINEVIGSNIVTAAVAGKSDEKFGVISSNIAEYTFSCNGEDWCIRASKNVDNDISGLYYDNITFEKDMDSTFYNDHVYMNRFFYDNVQYVISLNVEGKDISTSHFDDICNELKSNIVGTEVGYESELIEDGDDVIYKTTMHNVDGTTLIMEIIYTFDGQKMVSIVNNNIFDSEELAKEYYDSLVQEGASTDNLVLDGNKIIADMSSNVEFYADETKDNFVSSLKSSIGQ